MGLYNDDIWQRMSAEAYAAEIKEAMGEAAWVEAYARHLCCDDPQSQRFSFQVLKILGWNEVIEGAKPKPSLMARYFVANIPAALEGAQVRMGEAVTESDHCAFLFWHSIYEAIKETPDVRFKSIIEDLAPKAGDK